MKLYWCTLMLLFFNVIFAQSDEKKISKHPPKKIVAGISIGLDNLGPFNGIGLNIYAQYRLLNNRLSAGVGAAPMYTFNSISTPATQKDFFTDETTEIELETRLHLIPYHINFHYYVLHPNHNRFTARIDIKGGPSVQVVEKETVFASTLIGAYPDIEPFRLGYFYGGGITFEYFFRYFAINLDIGATYHAINEKITFFEDQNQVRTSLKIGVSASFGPKSRY